MGSSALWRHTYVQVRSPASLTGRYFIQAIYRVWFRFRCEPKHVAPGAFPWRCLRFVGPNLVSFSVFWESDDHTIYSPSPQMVRICKIWYNFSGLIDPPSEDLQHYCHLPVMILKQFNSCYRNTNCSIITCYSEIWTQKKYFKRTTYTIISPHPRIWRYLVWQVWAEKVEP